MLAILTQASSTGIGILILVLTLGVRNSLTGNIVIMATVASSSEAIFVDAILLKKSIQVWKQDHEIIKIWKQNQPTLQWCNTRKASWNKPSMGYQTIIFQCIQL